MPTARAIENARSRVHDLAAVLPKREQRIQLIRHSRRFRDGVRSRLFPRRQFVGVFGPRERRQPAMNVR